MCTLNDELSSAYQEPNVSVGLESLFSQPDMSSIIFLCLSCAVLCLAAPSFSIQHTHFLLYRTCLILTLLLSAPSARCFCFLFCTFWVELKNYADDCPSLDSLRISLPPSGLIIVLGFLLFPIQANSLYL